MLFHRVSAHLLHIKACQNGFELQTLHILICLWRIKILNLRVFIHKGDRTGNTDLRQFLAHNRHIVMLLQGFSCPGRLYLIQMSIGIFNTSISHNQVCSRLFSNRGNARNIVRGIAHQRLHINKFHRRYLVFPFYILRIIIVDLRCAAAGLGNADLDVGIRKL